jgi:phosphoribosylformimino-5-aminoimidazole carboxamide ribonucleotide (ProFAR) isomerase
MKLESSGIEGVIIGKALYDKTLSYADAKNLG